MSAFKSLWLEQVDQVPFQHKIQQNFENKTVKHFGTQFITFLNALLLP